MNTFMGISLDTWANVDGDCPIECEVVAAEAQIELGHRTGSLHLVMTESGLRRLVAVAGHALDEMGG
jgi:hypothetical protein